MSKHFLAYLEESIKSYWDKPVMSDIDGDTHLTYATFSKEIYRLHVFFDSIGVHKGDKIALCSGNCANWALSFMAVAACRGVVVSILPDFKPESIHGLVNHSEAKLFIVNPRIFSTLNPEEMPALHAIISMKDFSLLHSRDEQIAAAHANWDANFKAKYPNGISKEDVDFPKDNQEDLCLINYTSGTTSDPKGVMITYENISANTQYALETVIIKPGDTLVSMLPLAHMFGLEFEFIYPVSGGAHVHFLSKTPAAPVLMKAFADVKPYMFLTVPLVIEKIFKKAVFPKINKPIMKVLWHTPGIGRIIKNTIKKKLLTTFGGNLRYLIVGGAALSTEVENCLKAIKFPYCVGYGMTECAPLITYKDWSEFKKGSCGAIVDRMELKIDSSNPNKEVGEIMVKGAHVMQGYYKNPSATKAVLTEDGWLRTGDLGIVDKKGNLFIKGRSKNMILGPSGQNIYPEELEDKINAMPMVVESIVLQRDGNLVALVYPDYEAAGDTDLKALMEQSRLAVNKMVPNYCQIKSVELVENEFEKTPKRSIKRFLYK